MKKTFGMTLKYDNKQAVFTMPYKALFDHSLNATHGGVISTLLDNAGWFTAACFFDHWIVTTNISVQFLKPSSKSALVGTGRIIKYGKNIAFTEMEAKNENNELIAKGTASFYATSNYITELLNQK